MDMLKLLLNYYHIVTYITKYRYAVIFSCKILKNLVYITHFSPVALCGIFCDYDRPISVRLRT